MNRSMLICQVLKEQIVPKDAVIRLPLVTVLQIPWRRSGHNSSLSRYARGSIRLEKNITQNRQGKGQS